MGVFCTVLRGFYLWQVTNKYVLKIEGVTVPLWAQPNPNILGPPPEVLDSNPPMSDYILKL